MPRRQWLFWVLGVFVVLALGFAGWTAVVRPDADHCYACNRPVHAHSRTVALVNGRAKLFCCPACALSQHEQSGKPVRITQLTSYVTGRPVSPGNAFLVRGSDLNMCETTRELIDPDKRPADLRYDRCAPSLIAFENRADAVRFTREHGGEVRPFGEIAAAFAK